MLECNVIQMLCHGDFECRVNSSTKNFKLLQLNFLGGTDFGFPLQIQKVNPNSLAERCGMRDNDYILKIGQMSTEYIQHQEAQEQIKRQNNILELVLQRFVYIIKPYKKKLFYLIEVLHLLVLITTVE